MSPIDGIASALSDISSSSKDEVNKSIYALKIKNKNTKGFFSRKRGLNVSNQQN
jgi:hypothetical protein